MLSNHHKIIFAVAAVIMACFFVGGNTGIAYASETVNFNVDQHYDADMRSKVQATLVKTTSSLYFYVETNWWDAQNSNEKSTILNNFDSLSDEFNNNIHPTLTSVYGPESSPGIDNDTRITLLFESTKDNLGGYFRSADGYSNLQAPDSNQREMVYIPVAQIDNPQLKAFLAHEFVHVIEFNQKEKLQGVAEEIWLDEARADFAPTILGYNDVYEGSNLQRRVKDFLQQPNDSLTEWQDTKYDYAAVDLFMHYLVDHYGIAILADSLKSRLVGIPSINEALLKHGATEDFTQIFTNWTIAAVINNCAVDVNYCYLNKNLVNLKINLNLIFLPLSGDSSLSMNNTTKNWAANWQKIIGGNGDLTLDFSSLFDFNVPYILYDKNNNYTMNSLRFNADKKATITIKDFGNKYNSLIIIPSLQTKISGFDGSELAYPYTLAISSTKDVQEGPVLMQKLLDQIADLKKQIADIEAKNGKVTVNNNLCPALNNNLYVGVHSPQVNCLQEFLKLQGVAIYPQGLVTGIFGSLTKAAVIRFQKKYGIYQTGFVGILTRDKINSLLH